MPTDQWKQGGKAGMWKGAGREEDQEETNQHNSLQKKKKKVQLLDLACGPWQLPACLGLISERQLCKCLSRLNPVSEKEMTFPGELAFLKSFNSIE